MLVAEDREEDIQIFKLGANQIIAGSASSVAAPAWCLSIRRVRKSCELNLDPRDETFKCLGL